LIKFLVLNTLLLITIFVSDIFSEQGDIFDSTENYQFGNSDDLDSLNVLDPLNTDMNKETEDKRDSAEIDSIKTSLLKKLVQQNRPLFEHPKTAKGLFSPLKLSSYQLTRSDYFTWPDVMATSSEFSSLYITPRSHLNRTLFRGYLLPLKNSDMSVLTGIYSATLPPIDIEPVEVKGGVINPDGSIDATLHTGKKITPQLHMLMETGLFGGNSLDIRFVRNLSRNLTIGVYSSFRELDRKEYNHSSGTMGNFVTDIVNNTGDSWDKERQAASGINPHSQSQITTVNLQWKKKSTVNVSYNYSDLRHDLIYENPRHIIADTVSDTVINYDTLYGNTALDTVWYKNADYKSQLNFSGNLPFTDKLGGAFMGEITKNDNRLNPLNTQYLLTSDKKTGEISYQGASGEAYFTPFGGDTITIMCGVNRTATRRYDQKIVRHFQTNLLVKNRVEKVGNSSTYLDIDGGLSIFSGYDSVQIHPVFSATGSYNIGGITAQAWYKENIAPVVTSFDTAVGYSKNDLANIYRSFGGKIYLESGLFGITAGYSNIFGLKESTVKSYWYDQRLPYENPGQVFSFAPSFGEWHGISAISSWFISDELPNFRSTSSLRFHFNKPGRTRHLYLNFLYNYWSEQGYSDFGLHPESDWNNQVDGTNDQFVESNDVDKDFKNWGFAIHDVGFKITAETKAFRLFWKMDNILNRNHSYLPGYPMPGTIFRWGFAWTISG
jgi:hypothetical protein